MWCSTSNGAVIASPQVLRWKACVDVLKIVTSQFCLNSIEIKTQFYFILVVNWGIPTKKKIQFGLKSFF